MNSCPSCANSVPTGSRFCPTCGYALSSPTVEGRRVVTVLFADLVGFTTLSEHLDPEHVKRLVDACFQDLVDDITTFGGTVDKIVGDGILALFGVPVAHEDDAERAVRAALRMQDSVAEFASSRIASVVAPSLQMRVGINTGVALVGTIAGTDHTAMGDVVNTASRLQTLAPPGGVLVGETTHALTENSIAYESMGELPAKGRDAAVPAWLAKAAVSQPGARRRRRDVGIMGRSTELGMAVATVDFSIANSQAALLAVDGAGGVGKSRLVDELIGNVRQRPDALVLEGACVPYGEANAWWPLASALFERLDLDSSVSADEARAVAMARGKELFGDGDEATLKQLVDAFQHILGYPSRLDELDPAAARESIARSVTQVLERRLQRGPVLLSITDIHWADHAVLSLCEHLLVALARTPFLLVTTNRPDPDLVWPPLTTRAAVVRLPLEPLGRISAGQLVRAIIGPDVDDATIATIYERSGGNPLFLEELAALVADGGRVTELPESLRAVIAARLDQLPMRQRNLLDNAAVLGPSGAIASLERFSETLGQRVERSTLDALADSGLMAVDDRRWSFTSDSVREVAYNTLTKAVRAARHVGVAASMQERNVLPDDVAHHLAAAAEIAGELGPLFGVPTDIGAQAVAALQAAAQRAVDQGNLRQIVRSATRAIDLMVEQPRLDTANAMATLRLRRISALVELRSLERAREEARAVLADALATRNRSIEAGARRAHGLISQAAGDMASARRELGEAVDLYRELDDRHELAETLRRRGFLELVGGSLADAEWLFGEAAELYTEFGDRRGLGYIEQHRAWMAFLGGNMQIAEQRLNSASATLRELGDGAGLGWALGLLAFVKFFARRFDEAEQLAISVRAEAKERGDDWAEAMMMSLLASLRLWGGQLDVAAALAQQARDKFKRLDDGFGLSQSLAVLGRTQVALGDPNAARTIEALVSQPTLFGQSAYPMVAAAGIAMHAGDSKAAAQYADEAILRLMRMSANTTEAKVIRAIAAAQGGELTEAVGIVAQLDPGTRPFALAATALIRVLNGESEAALTAAEASLAADGHTYVDEVIAKVAAGAAAGALGRIDDARACLDDAIARATETQDMVAIALALATYQRVIGTPHPWGMADLGLLGSGWRAIVDALPLALIRG